MKTRPRRLFRSRPALDAAVAGLVADRLGGRLKPGTVTEARVWHNADCPMPKGGPCTCKAVDVELVPEGGRGGPTP